MTVDLLWALLGVVLGAAVAVGLGYLLKPRAGSSRPPVAPPVPPRGARRSSQAGLAGSEPQRRPPASARTGPQTRPQGTSHPRRLPSPTAVDIAIASQREAAAEAKRQARRRADADIARQEASRQAQPPLPEAPFSALSLPLDKPTTGPSEDAGLGRRRPPHTSLGSQALHNPLTPPAWTPNARSAPAAPTPAPRPQALHADPAAAAAAAGVPFAEPETQSQVSINPSELTALAPLPRPSFDATVVAGFEPTVMAPMWPPAPPRSPNPPAATPGFTPHNTPSVAALPPADAALTVLVVDDSKVVRIKISRLLEKHHYRVLLADDGLSAMQSMATDWPDLLISDVEMPGLDGFGLVEQLRQFPQGAALPVIMITSSNDKHREQASRVGIQVLLGKPYDEALLLVEVENALARVARPAPAGLVLQ